MSSLFKAALQLSVAITVLGTAIVLLGAAHSAMSGGKRKEEQDRAEETRQSSGARQASSIENDASSSSVHTLEAPGAAAFDKSSTSAQARARTNAAEIEPRQVQQMLSQMMSNIRAAEQLNESGQTAQALPYFAQAVLLGEQMRGGIPRAELNDFDGMVLRTKLQFGRALSHLQKHAEARNVLRDTVAQLRKLPGLEMVVDCGEMYLLENDVDAGDVPYEEMAPRADEIVEKFGAHFGEEVDTAMVLLLGADVHRVGRQFERVKEYAEKALAIFHVKRGHLPAPNVVLVALRTLLSGANHALGAFDEANAQMDEICGIARQSDAGSPVFLEREFAQRLFAQRRYEEAAQRFGAALAALDAKEMEEWPASERDSIRSALLTLRLAALRECETNDEQHVAIERARERLLADAELPWATFSPLMRTVHGRIEFVAESASKDDSAQAARVMFARHAVDGVLVTAGNCLSINIHDLEEQQVVASRTVVVDEEMEKCNGDLSWTALADDEILTLRLSETPIVGLKDRKYEVRIDIVESAEASESILGTHCQIMHCKPESLTPTSTTQQCLREMSSILSMKRDSI